MRRLRLLHQHRVDPLDFARHRDRRRERRHVEAGHGLLERLRRRQALCLLLLETSERRLRLVDGGLALGRQVHARALRSGDGRRQRRYVGTRRGRLHGLLRLEPNLAQLANQFSRLHGARAGLQPDDDLGHPLGALGLEAVEHAERHEDSLPAQLVLLGRHLHVGADGGCLLPGRARVAARDLRHVTKVRGELGVGHAVRVARARHAQRVEHAGRVQLARDRRLVPRVCRLAVVWLEATDEVELRRLEHVVQAGQLRAEGVDDALELGRLELGALAARLGLRGVLEEPLEH